MWLERSLAKQKDLGSIPFSNVFFSSGGRMEPDALILCDRTFPIVKNPIHVILLRQRVRDRSWS